MRYMIDTEGQSEADARQATERYMAVPGPGARLQDRRAASSRRCASARKRRWASASRSRAFHDLVLSQGTVPLDVLDRMVDAWIARRGAQKTAAKDA